MQHWASYVTNCWTNKALINGQLQFRQGCGREDIHAHGQLLSVTPGYFFFSKTIIVTMNYDTVSLGTINFFSTDFIEHYKKDHSFLSVTYFNNWAHEYIGIVVCSSSRKSVADEVFWENLDSRLPFVEMAQTSVGIG